MFFIWIISLEIVWVTNIQFYVVSFIHTVHVLQTIQDIWLFFQVLLSPGKFNACLSTNAFYFSLFFLVFLVSIWIFLFMINLALLILIIFSWLCSLREKSISPYSVRTRENTDQNNSEYGNFSRNGYNPLFQGVLVIISGFPHNDSEN